jgi:bifunctional DNA-binding transcriptional regulator/antitoxin component of YhaV-PrlF toxin-antitoxin module
MTDILSETVISSKYQTVVPSKIRKKYRVEPGDVLEWEVKGDMLIVKVRKKVTIDDIDGMIDVGGDSVKDKRKIQRGNK